MSGKMSGKAVLLAGLPEGVTLVDTHCHLDMDPYAMDCGGVVERAMSSGVTRCITIGIDMESSLKAVQLALEYPGVYAAVGVHPHNVEDATEQQYDKLAALAAHPKVVAYGEIGMDLVKRYAPADLQKKHFIRQLQMAKDIRLPLIIHDREAHTEILAALRDNAPYPEGGVMHCFSGDAGLAETVIKLDFFISIPGIVTFGKAETLWNVVRLVPLSRLLLETDAPFLAPAPYRGKRNEPAYILYTARKVAELKGISLEEVALRTTENAVSLFGLDEPVHKKSQEK